MFIVGGATRMDVRQGTLNDCWFLSALASLSLRPPLLERVVPSGQSFQAGYNGSFLFRFWQYGKWVDVKIDDLLPTKDGRLIFLSSPEKNEFWSALLEKAYAKLKGGYTALNMGFPHEAMVDLTGGVTEVVTIASLPRDMLGFLRPLLLRGALINCANCQGEMEKKNRMGIMFRHAYSVTSLEMVQTRYGTVELIRVHNPWGNTEWEGPWGDGGSEWDTVSKEEQRRVQRVQQEDGEFWMAVSDFRENFETMEVCHLSMDTLSQSDCKHHPWHCTAYHGSWMPGGRYWQNPQFKLTLLEEDEDPCDPRLTCSFLVALMQKNQRREGSPRSIRLDIYLASSMSKFLSTQDISTPRPILSTNAYLPHREIVIRGRLAPGHYFLVPAVAEPNPGGEFLLRVLTEKGNAALPMDHVVEEQDFVPETTYPHLSALPNPTVVQELFQKHCNRCSVQIQDWLNWTGRGSKTSGTRSGIDEPVLSPLEYEEVPPALKAAGLKVDDFILQLIGLRYTEPDMTISYPGFLFLMMKLDSMIHKFQAYDVVGMGTVSITTDSGYT
ncbi:calpain-1 catalytic subunit [Aplochiton taeniatus]